MIKTALLLQNRFLINHLITTIMIILSSCFHHSLTWQKSAVNFTSLAKSFPLTSMEKNQRWIFLSFSVSLVKSSSCFWKYFSNNEEHLNQPRLANVCICNWLLQCLMKPLNSSCNCNSWLPLAPLVAHPHPWDGTSKIIRSGESDVCASV